MSLYSDSDYTDSPIPARRRSGGRILMALALAAFALFSYYSNSAVNPVTGEKQQVAMSVPQEVALGLQSAPQMAAQHGGEDPNSQDRARVDSVGRRLLQGLGKNTPYEFNFHLLRDPQTINAFALPGGQVFITRALYDRLETEGQLAGVIAHEIGHVLERHSAQQIAKAQLTQGLTGAAVLATYDPNDPRSRNSAAMAAIIGGLVTMKFGRGDELESDQWGVRLTASAGYDPRSMIRVMEILAEASGGGRTPEFFSTHPNPENRIGRIKDAIDAEFPNGVPGNLQK